jgi:hypothetical protein
MVIVIMVKIKIQMMMMKINKINGIYGGKNT